MLSVVSLPVYAGSSLVDMIKGGAKKSLLPDGLDLDDGMVEFRVRAVWVVHGFVAAIGSLLSGPLGGAALTHWWVEIKTGKAYYCAQFDWNDELTLTKHQSEKEVTERGKLAAGSYGEDKNISDKYIGFPRKDSSFERYTMRDIVHFMNRYNGTYNLVNNNSQHFGKAFYKKF